MNKILIALMILLSCTFIYLSMPTGIDAEQIIQSYNVQAGNSKSNFESKKVFELAYENGQENKPVDNPYGGSSVVGTGEVKSFSYPTEGPKMILYIQGDPQWGGVLIKSPDRTISTSGCGYCSLAMVISYLTGTQVTPPDIVALTGSKYHTGGGISHQAFYDIPAQFGLKTAVVQSNTFDEVDTVLDQGGVVLCSVKKGVFTNNAHIIVIRGKNAAGEYLVNNPSDNPTKNHFNMSFSRDVMEKQIKFMYGVTK